MTKYLSPRGWLFSHSIITAYIAVIVLYNLPYEKVTSTMNGLEVS